MIDKKKIEKAAHQHMIDEYNVANTDDWEFPCDTSDIKQQCEDDFKAGVQWAQKECINSLWHNTSEKPEGYDDWIIIKYDRPNYALIRQVKEVCNNWEMIVKCMPPSQWCYLSDILPKETKDFLPKIN